MSVSVSVTDSALQNKRFKDHIQPAKMQFCFLDLGNPSCKPAAWKSACENGSTKFKAVSVQAAEERRAHRYATYSNPTFSGPRWPTCDRIFASEFGFRSHRRSRSRHQLQSHNVVVEIDGLQRTSNQQCYRSYCCCCMHACSDVIWRNIDSNMDWRHAHGCVSAAFDIAFVIVVVTTQVFLPAPTTHRIFTCLSAPVNGSDLVSRGWLDLAMSGYT